MRVKNQQGCLYRPRQRNASSIPAPAASARQRTVRVVQAAARDSRARRETHLPRGIRRQQHETPFEHRRFRRVADVHRDEQQATAVNRNHSSITPFKIEPSPDNAAQRAGDRAGDAGGAKRREESLFGEVAAVVDVVWQTGLAAASPSAPEPAWPKTHTAFACGSRLAAARHPRVVATPGFPSAMAFKPRRFPRPIHETPAAWPIRAG